MRFGRWEEVLAEPKPGVDEPLSQALWHFTRAVALTASDRLQEAHVEEEAYQKATTRVPSFRFGNNSARAVLRVATRMLSGEMAAKEGRLEEAIATLRQAVEMEDALQYDEPPNWLLPVRHALGAVLLKAGKPGEAESVYREDLRQYPANGWSLQGLTRALSRQGKRREAAAVAVQFRKAWKDADVPIESSCLCIRGE
jgi:tetratricopeptide (TPR) repeat protein